MGKLLSMIFAVFISFLDIQAAESPYGFVIWSEGRFCDQELKYQKLEKGTGPVGDIKTVLEKGEGADVNAVISFDGRWIAFSRSIGAFEGGVEPCGYYHDDFDKFDIYIARIDGKLPAKPVKIGHGYRPSWGDDSHRPVKTLYYTMFEEQTIWKTTVKSDGSFTSPLQHAKYPLSASRRLFDALMAPNGQYVALRWVSAIKVWDIKGEKYIEGAGGSGFYPSWGPRSEFLLWAKNNVCVIKGGIGKKIGRTGLGERYYGMCNGAEMDRGGLWATGTTFNTGSNFWANVEVRPIDISNGGWRAGPAMLISDKGTWSDIHVFKDGNTSASENRYKFNPELIFNTKLIDGATGLQLTIDAGEFTVNHAELYDMLGKKNAFAVFPPSANYIFPLKNIPDGRYVLELEAGKLRVQKAIRISR